MDNQYNYYKPESDDSSANTGNSYNSDSSYNSNGSQDSGNSYNSSGSYDSGNSYNNSNYYTSGGSYNYYHQEPPKQKKKFPKKLVSVVVSAVIFGVVAGCVFQGTNYIFDKFLTDNSQENVKTVSNAQLTTSNSTVTSDISEIVEASMPSIVSITNTSVQQVMSFFGGVSEIPSESAGSGIIISQNDTELLIVTNNHVVEDSDTLTVTFCDETSIEAVTKGTDSARDLAVIAVALEDIPDETKDAIKVAVIGDSDSLKVGEPAIAIGNALGYGQSVTTGIVSAVERGIDGYEGNYIQTDAAINPGNSGGALLNINGELIGINSAKISDSSVEGMGFAIPISDVTDIIETLMNRTKVNEEDRGYIGIKGYDVTEEGAKMYNMPTGVYIAEVVEGGAAEAAGITKGSIITGFEGMSIDGMESLQEQLTYYAAGTEVTVTIQTPTRDGEYVESEVVVTLKKNNS